MFISILGRQPALGIAELERLYGSATVKWFSKASALVDHDQFDFERLGGSQKAGKVILELPHGEWRDVSIKIIRHYSTILASVDHKITLGISVYDCKASPRDIQKTGLMLKQRLRLHGVSLRLIPNAEATLNTATSHHNKLGLSPNKIELIIVRATDGRIVVAESVGAQNITALAARDQARPYTDAFVGMLPPKLARMMVNLALGSSLVSNLPKQSVARAALAARDEAVSGDFDTKKSGDSSTILDPFCGTGVVLQEALLLGYSVCGTDLSDKMVDYSTKNIAWLATKYPHISDNVTIEQGDAITRKWHIPIDAVVCETYLGQPFSAPPSPAKLTEVRGNCNHIVSSFLQNLAGQLLPGTPLCIAIPAWRDAQGNFTHLPLIDTLEKLGYTRHHFSNIVDNSLLYYRENQVVARELLVLTKA